MNGRRLPLIPRERGTRLLPEEATEAYREISDILAKAFNSNDECLSSKEIYWSSIKLCLRILKRFCHELKLFWKTVYLLFEYFEKCKNPELSPVVADVVYFIVYESFYGHFMLPTKDLPRKRSVLCDMYEQNLHNIIFRLMRTPYRLHRTVVIPEVDIVWGSVMIDSERLLPILLRQGVAYIPPSSHTKGWEYCIDVLYNICYLADVWQRFDSRTLTIKLGAQDPVLRRRIFTVFRAMDVVQHKMRSIAHMRIWWERDTEGNFIDRHRMIFDTIPEPFVTLQEVRHILESIFDPIHAEVVNNFCSKFEDFIPESVEPLHPRSLKHLSRCQMRQNLRMQGLFPYGVYKMLLPQAIKDYILLEDWYSSDAVKIENEKLNFEEVSDEEKHSRTFFGEYPPFDLLHDDPVRSEFFHVLLNQELQPWIAGNLTPPIVPATNNS